MIRLNLVLVLLLLAGCVEPTVIQGPRGPIAFGGVRAKGSNESIVWRQGAGCADFWGNYAIVGSIAQQFTEKCITVSDIDGVPWPAVDYAGAIVQPGEHQVTAGGQALRFVVNTNRLYRPHIDVDQTGAYVWITEQPLPISISHFDSGTLIAGEMPPE